MIRLSRRKYLALAIGAPALAGTRQLGRSPLISVQDFAQFPALTTPVEDFYVRNHFEVPAFDLSRYSLRIVGLVERERELSLPELIALPQTKLTAVLECAGNGVGVGAVGCATWHGVRLGDLLRRSAVRNSARFVRITGADRGTEPDAGDVAYSRTLTIEEAMSERAIIALGMNGSPLLPDHGAPARVIAAGRYGMDSVKWLRSLELVEEPDNSVFMSRRFRRVKSGSAGEPVGDIKVKSIIVRPVPNQALRGEGLIAGGYAWAGRDAIARVEVRFDTGAWVRTRLLNAPKPLEWVAWEIALPRLNPGAHIVEARATSLSGESQPEQRDPMRGDDYELNQVHRVRFLFRP